MSNTACASLHANEGDRFDWPGVSCDLSHIGPTTPLTPILFVQSLGKYQYKENATHVHRETVLCSRLALITKIVLFPRQLTSLTWPHYVRYKRQEIIDWCVLIGFRPVLLNYFLFPPPARKMKYFAYRPTSPL